MAQYSLLPLNAMRRNNPSTRLDTHVLEFETKKLCIDLKKDKITRFFIFAATGQNGSRFPGLYMTVSAAEEMINKLSTEFAEIYDKLGVFVPDPAKQERKDATAGDGDKEHDERKTLHSVSIRRDHRKYFISLKENVTGRFLHVNAGGVSYGGRSKYFIIPATGMKDVVKAVRDMLDKHPVVPGEEEKAAAAVQEMSRKPVGPPKPRSMRAGDSMLYFDFGHDRRGFVMRVSEWSYSSRAYIDIPQDCVVKMRDVLTDVIHHMKLSDSHQGGGKSGGGRVVTLSETSHEGGVTGKGKKKNKRSRNSSKLQNGDAAAVDACVAEDNKVAAADGGKH